MAIFNSKLLVYQRVTINGRDFNPKFGMFPAFTLQLSLLTNCLIGKP